MRAFMLATIAIAIAATGCGKTLRPGYCRTQADCTSGICDIDGGSFMCREAGAPDAPDGPDGGDGGDGDGGTDADASDAGDGPFLCTNSVQCIGHDAGSVCEREAGACVECLPSSGTCSGTKPVCAGTTCVPCTKDSECNTSTMICMPDGHCATDTEVIFVELKSAGCPGQNGSAAAPFCTIALAVAQLDTMRRVIVIRGPIDDKLILNTPGSSPIVVGRPNASSPEVSIPAGGGVAVTITAGDVRIRDLTINLGSTNSKGIVVSGASTKLTLSNVKVATTMGLGIQADTGADLVMDRCFIQNNSTGGLLINGASYSIENSVFAANGYGIKFNATAIPRASHASFNTIVGNVGNAVTCDSTNSQTIADSIVVGLNDSCTLLNFISTMPTFRANAPYHLMGPIGCPGTPAMVPAFDIDGDPRVAPIDCGADQFVP